MVKAQHIPVDWIPAIHAGMTAELDGIDLPDTSPISAGNMPPPSDTVSRNIRLGR